MHAHITLSPRQMAIAVAAVALGGAAGTLMRALVLKLQPDPASMDWTAHIPWILLAVNMVGVYSATRLLRGPLRHHDPNDTTRLLVVTGLLGGFTSYSSLWVGLAAIWHLSVLGSLLVGAGALASGVLAAWAGLQKRHAR